MEDSNSICTKPFLRWAGGKNWLIKYIDQFLPESFNNYHEPFLGGGSIFIHLMLKGYLKHSIFLSDQNIDLINSYTILKENPKALFEQLFTYNNTKDEYYLEREKNYSNSTDRASQFIFLNRTSFNGIYRVNLQGEYNVPYGYKEYEKLFEFENMQKVSNLLQNCYLKAGDFEASLKNIGKGDFIFLDPPYTVAHGKNGFVKYNQKIFSWKDQERLKKYIEILIEKEAYFLMTNADHSSIRDLFSGLGKCDVLSRASLIGGKKAKREHVTELIYYNFKING